MEIWKETLRVLDLLIVELVVAIRITLNLHLRRFRPVRSEEGLQPRLQLEPVHDRRRLFRLYLLRGSRTSHTRLGRLNLHPCPHRGRITGLCRRRHL